MQDWNAPLDISHQLAREIMARVRTDLFAVHDRASVWQPSPMPDDYAPSPDDHLQPRSYDSPYHVLGDAWMRTDDRGDKAFFYDYRVQKGRRATARMYP